MVELHFLRSWSRHDHDSWSWCGHNHWCICSDTEACLIKAILTSLTSTRTGYKKAPFAKISYAFSKHLDGFESVFQAFYCSIP